MNKLSLHKESIRVLEAPQAEAAQGGAFSVASICWVKPTFFCSQTCISCNTCRVTIC